MWPMHDDQVLVAMVTRYFISSKQLNTVQHAEVTVNFHVTVHLGSSHSDCLYLGQENFTVLKLAP